MSVAAEADALQHVLDRQAIIDVVVQYATGIDHRDWELYASCFTDPCEFDFSRWRGQPPVVTSPSEWAAKVRGTNGSFDATQHLSTNHVVRFEGADDATCVSNMQAQHWFSAARLTELGYQADAPRWCTLGGFYTNSIVRRPDGWRIRRCQLDVTWITGDPAVFEIARALGDRG